MKKRTAVLLFALTAAAPLAGCVSAAQLRAQDEANCTGYGFSLGTPSFATCLQNETLAREAYWSAADAYDFYGPFGPYDYGYYPGPFFVGGWHYHHWDRGGYHGAWAHGWHGSRFAGAVHGGGAPHGGGGGGHH